MAMGKDWYARIPEESRDYCLMKWNKERSGMRACLMDWNNESSPDNQNNDWIGIMKACLTIRITIGLE